MKRIDAMEIYRLLRFLVSAYRLLGMHSESTQMCFFAIQVIASKPETMLKYISITVIFHHYFEPCIGYSINLHLCLIFIFQFCLGLRYHVALFIILSCFE